MSFAQFLSNHLLEPEEKLQKKKFNIIWNLWDSVWTILMNFTTNNMKFLMLCPIMFFMG